MAAHIAFGRFFKQLRMRKGYTLRSFCMEYGLDPGNISKMERGKLPPPQGEKLEQYARILGLKKGENDWYQLFDLAAACRGKIPEDIMNDQELSEKLPLVFRTIRGQKLTKEQLEDLAKVIRDV